MSSWHGPLRPWEALQREAVERLREQVAAVESAEDTEERMLDCIEDLHERRRTAQDVNGRLLVLSSCLALAAMAQRLAEDHGYLKEVLWLPPYTRCCAADAQRGGDCLAS
jgi:hypothetical protein